MRHRRNVQHFSRNPDARRALLRGLVNNLVEHERIKSTVTKVKELRRHVEKAVTLGKKNTLHAQRLLLARYPNEDVVNKIMKDLAPRFKDRNGGYTRIIKLGRRVGDSSEMAYIEFVDYDPTKQEIDEAANDKAEKLLARRAAKKKKSLRKIQKKSRRINRAS